MFSIRSRLTAANVRLVITICAERLELLYRAVVLDATTICKTAQVYTSPPLSVQPKESERASRKSGGGISACVSDTRTPSTNGDDRAQEKTKNPSLVR
jgi:hypothetical protein